MNTLEKWSPIIAYNGHMFDGKYEISNWGNIRNKATQKPLATYSNQKGQGYLKTKIHDLEGHRVALYIHRLVALNFIEGQEGTTEINHKDGNVHNNSWTNLEWCTHQQNVTHYHNGRKAG